MADAVVVLYAEPNRRAPLGKMVTIPTIGSTRTDADGCYRIPIRSSDRLTRAADKYGLVNLMLVLQRPGQLEMTTVSRSLFAAGSRITMRQVNTADARPAALYRPTGKSVAVRGAIHQSFGPQADQQRREAHAARTSVASTVTAGGFEGTTAGTGYESSTAPEAGLPTSTTDTNLDTSKRLKTTEKVDEIYSKRPVLVGQWWSSMAKVQQTWKYTEGASSQLGTAEKFYSGGGSYEKGETRAKSSQSDVTFPTSHGKSGLYFLSFWRYAKYDTWWCSADTGDCTITVSRVKPYSWERGAKVVRGLGVPKTPRKNCSPYVKGAIDTTRGTRAVTWTNGVNVGGDLAKEIGANFSLQSQTGFTQSAENVVHYRRHGWLCGVFGPLSKPGAVLARKFR